MMSVPNTTSTPTPALEPSARFLGRSLLLAIVALVGLNVAAFLVFYRDTLGSVALPYTEDFSQTTRLDLRQFGGSWQLQDGALVQRDPELPDMFAVLPAHLADGASGSISTTLRFTSPNDGAGVLFGMEQADDRRGSHLVRFGRGKDGAAYLAYGSFDRDLVFTGQGSAPMPDLPESVRLTVRFGPSTYDVLVDDVAVAQGVPLLFHGGHVALTTWFSSAVFDDILLDESAAPAAPASTTPAAPAQPDPTTAPAPVVTTAPAPDPTTAPAPVATAQPAPVATAVPIATISTDTASLGHVGALIEAFEATDTAGDWRVMMGDWSRKDGALVQSDTTTYDRGIVHRATVGDVSIKVHLTQLEGLGAGILFGLPRVDSLRGGSLVRFGKDGALFWGSFDDQATFTGQGYAQTGVQPGETHLLEVRVSGTTYAIALDGTVLASGLPMSTADGHFGLTTSVSRSAFEDVTIAPLDAAAAAATASQVK